MTHWMGLVAVWRDIRILIRVDGVSRELTVVRVVSGGGGGRGGGRHVAMVAAHRLPRQGGGGGSRGGGGGVLGSEDVVV